MKTKIKATTRQEELMYAFNFSDADLEANREGRFTEEHRLKVSNRESTRGIGLVLVGIIAGIMWTAWFLAALSSPNTELYMYLVLIIFIGLSCTLVAAGYVENSITHSEIDFSRVEAVQGIAVIDAELRGKQVVKIGSLQFKANRDALLRIKHLEPHIVYFLPRSKIIVSVEVVEE
jgi:hypothetical protein